MFFLFLHENICCGYSLEAPRQGASNEYPQYMFLWRNKKNINTFGMKKASYQELQYNLNGSNTDGSFTVDDSNSFFSPYKILPIAQENK